MKKLIYSFLVIHTWINLISLAASASELVIKPFGENHNKAAGKAIVFTCQVLDSRPGQPAASSVKSYQIEWLNKHNQPITVKEGRVYVEDDGDDSRKLYITNISPQDEGRYTCTAILEGKRHQKSVNLKQYEDILFVSVPTPQHPSIHTNALIVCRVGGSAVVSWRFKGRRITSPSPGGRYKIEEGGLRVNNITREDNGDYTCMAEVQAAGSYEERNISVTVYIPPVITTPLNQLIERIEGEEAEFICRASGLPTPNFEFTKENSVNPLLTSIDARIKVTSQGHEGSMIQFKPVQSDDSGRYTCTARNDAGRVTSTGTLKVLVRPKIQTFVGVSEDEGQSVMLTCVSRGLPGPNMTFTKYNPITHKYTEFKVGENPGGRVVRDPESGRLELVIPSLIPDDAGNYTCRAANKVGQDVASAMVVVKFRPRFVEDHNTTGFIWPGKATNVTCNVRSEPAPSVEWSKDGIPITINNFTYNIFTSGLNNSLQVRMNHIEEDWLYARYHCRVSNIYGDAMSTIELRKAVIPSVDLTVTVKDSEIEPNKVILHISHSRANNDTLPIIGYRVQYLGKIQEFKRNGDVIELENLAPSTTYTIEVYPRNEVGPGRASKRQVKTANKREPYTLEIISNRTGHEGYNYELLWRTPSTGGSPLKQYEFKYRKAKEIGPGGAGGRGQDSKKQADWIKIDYNDNPLEPIRGYNLSGLEPETSYEVEIRVKNDLGWSNTTKLFLFSTVKATVAEIQTLRFKAGLAAAAVLLIFLIILIIIIDISCYCSRRRGITAYCCLRAGGGRERAGDKGKSIELGEGKEMLKHTEEDKNHDKQAHTQTNSPPEVNNLDDTPTKQYKRTPPHNNTNIDSKEESKLLLANEETGFGDEIINTDEATREDIQLLQQQQQNVNNDQQQPQNVNKEQFQAQPATEADKQQPQLINFDESEPEKPTETKGSSEPEPKVEDKKDNNLFDQQQQPNNQPQLFQIDNDQAGNQQQEQPEKQQEEEKQHEDEKQPEQPDTSATSEVDPSGGETGNQIEHETNI